MLDFLVLVAKAAAECFNSSVSKPRPGRHEGRLTLHSDCFDSRNTSLNLEREILSANYLPVSNLALIFSSLSACGRMFARRNPLLPAECERLLMLGRENRTDRGFPRIRGSDDPDTMVQQFSARFAAGRRRLKWMWSLGLCSHEMREGEPALVCLWSVSIVSFGRAYSSNGVASGRWDGRAAGMTSNFSIDKYIIYSYAFGYSRF